MAVTYRSTGLYNSTGSTTAVVVAPAGLTNGDLIFVIIRRAAAVNPTGVPAGWTLARSLLSTYGFWLYYKVASGEGASWTWTWAASAKTLGRSHAFYGNINTVTPVQNSTAPYSGNTTGTVITIPTLTTSAANTESFIFASGYSTSAKTFTVPVSPAYTEYDDSGNVSPDFYQAIASYNYPTSGTATGTTAYPASANCTYRIGCRVLVNTVPPVDPPATNLNSPADGIWDSDTTPTLNFTGTDETVLGSSFATVGAPAYNWQGVAINQSSNDVYACVYGGDIYKQTAGSGSFTSVSAGTNNWFGVAVNLSNSDVYACVASGNIYKQTAGIGSFVTVGAGTRNWYGISVNPTNGDVYACVYGGDIYKQTAGSGSFDALSAGTQNWNGVYVNNVNGDVFACVSGGDIYKQTAGSGSFAAVGAGTRSWNGVFVSPANKSVYGCVYGGDIYKQIGGSGAFDSLSVTTRNWTGIALRDNSGGGIYACAYGVGIYKAPFSANLEYNVQISQPGISDFEYAAQTDIQPTKNWTGISVDSSNGNVYVITMTGTMYKKNGTTGAWSSQSVGVTNTVSVYVNPTTKDVYTTVGSSGDIYKQTAGTGNYVALGTNVSPKTWGGISVNPTTNDVYACVYNGLIYKQTGGLGNYVTTGASTTFWGGVSVNPTNNDVYACVSGGDVWKQTGGIGSWVAQNAKTSAQQWYGIYVNPTNNDVWAVIFGGDIYKQTAGTGSYIAQNVAGGANGWYGAVVNTSNDDVWACIQDGEVYKKSVPLISAFSSTNAGFTAGHPFATSLAVDYTVQAGSALLANKTYYWRATAINPSGSNVYGSWSGVRSFVTSAPNDSPTVALNSPSDQAFGQDEMPVLNFTGTDPDSDNVEYNIQVDKNATFDSVVGGSTTVYTNSFETAGWTSVLVNGTAASWSILTASVHPTGVSMQDGSHLAGFNSYTCTAGAQARYYPGTTFNIPSDSSASSATFWIYHETGYTTNNDQVQLQISTNAGTDWSNVGAAASRYNGTTGWEQITIDLVAYTGLSNILIGFLGISGYGNDVYIDNLSVSYTLPNVALIDKSSIIDVGFTAGHPFVSGVAKDYTVQSGEALADGYIYYWRVRAIDPLGRNIYGDWTTARSFTVGNVPPTAAIDSPNDAQLVSTTPDLVFIGTDIESDQVEFNLQINTSSDFNNQVLADSYDSSNASGATQMYGGQYTRIGQSFTAIDGNLDAIDMYGFKTGSPTGTAVIKVYTHSGTYGTSSLPTGSALAVSDTVDVTTWTTGAAIRSFVFSGANRVALTNGTRYCLAIEYTGGNASNYIAVDSDGTSPTHAGNAYYWNDVSSVWILNATYDGIFYVYEDTPILTNVFSTTDAGFSSGHPYDSGALVTYTVQNALALGTYYWRVSATDPSGSNTYGGWSDSQSFVTVNNAPPSMVLGAPNNGTQGVPAQPTFQFTGTDPEGDNVEYEVQVDTVNTFNSNGGGSSTTLYTNSFEAAGWTSTLVAGTNSSWSILTASVRPTGVSMQDGTHIAGFNSYTCTAGAQARYYPSSTMTIPQGAGSAVLKFWIYHETGYPTANDKVQLQISRNGGSSWANVGSAASRYNGTTGWEQITVSVANYVGASNILIGFLGTSGYGNDVYIDNITVLYDMPLLNKFSTTDAGFSAGHPFTSGDVVNYTIQLGDALSYGIIHYWRVRAIDPLGINAYGQWSEIRSFRPNIGMKVWGGSSWSYKPIKIYGGSGWVVKPVKVWDGTEWVNKG